MLIINSVCFSGVYERVETKGKRAFLRFKARQIADCEALHHFHFRFREPEPKYIYYMCHSKKFEKWYKSIKDNQSAIYEDLKEKSISKYIDCFKESTYDEDSIWKFDNDNVEKDKTKDRETIEKKIKKLRRDIDSIENLLKLDIKE